MTLHNIRCLYHTGCSDPPMQHLGSHSSAFAAPPYSVWAALPIYDTGVCARVPMCLCLFVLMTLTAGGWTPRCVLVFCGRITGRWDCAWLDVSRLMSFPSLTSAATAAAWAKLETGTQTWPAFTRLIYIVPQMCHAIMPCQLHIKIG